MKELDLIKIIIVFNKIFWCPFKKSMWIINNFLIITNLIKKNNNNIPKRIKKIHLILIRHIFNMNNFTKIMITKIKKIKC